MGQAKNRGTFEERKAIAIARKEAEQLERIKAKPVMRIAGSRPASSAMTMLGVAAAALSSHYPKK